MRSLAVLIALALAGSLHAQGNLTIVPVDAEGTPLTDPGINVAGNSKPGIAMSLDTRLEFFPYQGSWEPNHMGDFSTRRRGEIYHPDANGEVRISDLLLGDHEIWCLTSRGEAARQVVALSAEEPSLEVRLAVDPLPHRGRVTDEEGNALPGVKVQFASYHRGSSFVFEYEEETRVTDRDGNFAVPALGSVVILEADGFAAKLIGVRVGEFEEVVLTPAVTLEGQILRADGSPAHCTEVELRMNYQRGRPHIGTEKWTGRTDEEGRFLANGLQPREWTLRAWGAIQDQTFEVDLSESQEMVFTAVD